MVTSARSGTLFACTSSDGFGRLATKRASLDLRPRPIWRASIARALA